MTHISKTPEILRVDPHLQPYQKALEERMRRFADLHSRLAGQQGRLSDFANGHMFFGFHREMDGWVFREWALNAKEIFLFGDFNDWNRQSHPLTRLDDDVWEIRLSGADALAHRQKVRLLIRTKQGEELERIPLYCHRAVQNPQTLGFDGQIWSPPEPYQWQVEQFSPNKDEPLLIYECHIGMAGEEERVSTYAEFTERILPRVKRLGYNAIQLMAIMEHPYYGSFGYQVSNFFAASSRFGTPEELMHLIDTAHGMGIAVLLDLVHSHAAKNESEGIARFDGTYHQFFHQGERGVHPQWDSRLFDYGKPGVLHFLLSNIKFWLTHYRFDGFRFDGVTSMLYHDHGIGEAFTNYGQYFSSNTDLDAIAYLQLATALSREINERCILIAEDMSGMPGIALPVAAGGIGFDYRLGMGIADLWIRYIEDLPDERWDVGHLWHELTQRRPGERVIGYCESHDQALVGDKTIMFRLADQAMYWQMDNDSQSPVIDRAIALHKMIRLITLMTAGEGYLTFMGNEFGHPEWIDFPREGNGYSYARARRQWGLAENGYLRYGRLMAFDIDMLALAKEHNLLSTPSRQLWQDNEAKLLIFSKGDLLFFFNLHPTLDYEAEIELPGTWEIALHTSWTEYGGYLNHADYVISPDSHGILRTRVDTRSAIVYRRRG